MKTNLIICLLVFSLYSASDLYGQRKKKTTAKPQTISYDDSLFTAMSWRNIGPFRGGRSTASTGVKGHPYTYYFGSVGGGVWKTEDAGLSWKNVSDHFFNATSIGAIAVSESDPNVVYVGTGEACVRGVMTSHGDGVYKSTDAGETWKHIGLEKTMQISAICIHPTNPDIVYVAAQGSPYTATPDRGVFRSLDGGASWTKVHFVDNHSSVSDLSMDMNNPRILYAAYWDNQRMPWFIRSGGPGSGIWRTMDAGETWTKLSKGLPSGVMGKIGVSVSRANSNRVYAIIEAEKGGLYRSDDKGKKWKLMNSERILRTRSWYYMHVFADPNNEDVVYVLNAPFNKSIDGGKTFTQVRVPHGDNHNLWINPDNSLQMINSNDGGANISMNGGKSWSTQQNQPTAQFYRVNADNRFPYWLYAGQQDNSTLAIPNATDGFGIGWQDWHANVGGGEAAHVAFNPDDPTYIYSSNITGFIDEYNLKTGKQRAVKPYPILDLGEPSDQMKFRYNWNPPVMVSRHHPEIIYYGSNVIHRSENRANNWEVISPDLTRNDSSHLGLMGGPITNEAAGGEIYHTLMTLADSPHDDQVLWAGADDGLVHVTTDNALSWKEVSPGPEGIINSIEVSPFHPQTVYITLMRYKFNDFHPYIYKTTDNGAHWKKIVHGLPEGSFARVVRADPDREGLLFAGTERGIYISFDDGILWKKFQLNLPMVPITDLKIHHQDLLAATHGRAFWILDDLTPLHQINKELASSAFFVYKPRNVVGTYNTPNPKITTRGTNPYPGASIYFYLANYDPKDSLNIDVKITNDNGQVVRHFLSSAKSKSKKFKITKGMNVLRWDLMTDPISTATGVMPAGKDKELMGYHVGPGSYTATFTLGERSQSQSFNVVPDPRDGLVTDAMQAKIAAVDGIYNNLKDLYRSLNKLQEVRTQINTMTDRLDDDAEVKDMGKKIMKNVNQVENALISPKQKTFQDIINFRNKLDRQLYNLMQIIDSNSPPLTGGEKQLGSELKNQWIQQRTTVDHILKVEIKAFNNLLREKGVEYIAPKKEREQDKSTT